MRTRTIFAIAGAVAAGGVPGTAAQPGAGPSPYLLAFAGDRDEKQSDFFAVIDVRAGSPSRGKVVAILDEVGFAPEADARATTVRLTRCPLLETAKEYPDVVCGVHLGIVRGALEEYGADSTRTDLLPFAEPGACRLHLLTRAEHR